MTPSPTFLSLGQRYAQLAESAVWPDRQVVVSSLGEDPFGLPVVTFRCQDGREVTTYTAQVELAVAAGELFPVVGAGAVARC
jgi:hypothetical protein